MADGYGSFGWAIAIDDNTILGSGKAQGQRTLMQSFRAEVYVMLAALRFLLNTCKFEAKWPQNKKVIHTNSNGIGKEQ